MTKKKRTLNSAVSLRLEKNLFACFSHLKQLLLEIRKSPFSWSGCRVLSFRTELTSITKYVNLLWNPLYIYIHIYVYVYKYFRVLPFGITSIFQELVNFIYSIAFSGGFWQMSQNYYLCLRFLSLMLAVTWEMLRWFRQLHNWMER